MSNDNSLISVPPHRDAKIAVVIPCYRVTKQVLNVIAWALRDASWVFCVDDACPEHSGRYIQNASADRRVTVLFHEQRQGVGKATVTGYRAAIESGATIVINIDSNARTDSALISMLATPIQDGRADFTKGNRFYRPEGVSGASMPRLLRNSFDSFLSKFSTGYWDLFDYYNGCTAIHGDVLRRLPLDKLSGRVLFPSDLLFRLSLLRAVVLDIPMDAKDFDEQVDPRTSGFFGTVLFGHLKNFAMRLFYKYYVRDFNIASVEWLLGPLLVLFGLIFGVVAWIDGRAISTTASMGTIMLSALPIILGLQLLRSAINFDAQNVPRRAIHPDLRLQPVSAQGIAIIRRIKPRPKIVRGPP